MGENHSLNVFDSSVSFILWIKNNDLGLWKKVQFEGIESSPFENLSIFSRIHMLTHYSPTQVFILFFN
jgi:hypothetical protein